MAVLITGLATSSTASAQKVIDGALLRIEASSTVLFTTNEADQGAENPIGTFGIVAGSHINQFLSAGLGFGFHAEMKGDSKTLSLADKLYSEQTTSTISTPLFIYLRGDILPDAKICPFVSAEIGYKATLARADDHQKGDFYNNLKVANDIIYSRYYNAGAFAELTAGISMALGQGHALDLGVSFVDYTRKHTEMTLKSGSQNYNTTSEGKHGIAFKIGVNF